MQSLLVQLLLSTLALGSLTLAAPLDVNTMDANMQYGTGGGILGFIVLVLDVIVWIEVLKSKRPVSHKLLWSLLVFIFPVVGVIVYWLLSDRKKWNDHEYEVLP